MAISAAKWAKVQLVPVSSWQKPGCLFGARNEACYLKATKEAVYTYGKATARIRCCEHPICIDHAKETAITQTETMG